MRIWILLSILALSNCGSSNAELSSNPLSELFKPVKAERPLLAIPVQPFKITKPHLTKEEKAIQDCLDEADKLRVIYLYDRGSPEFSAVAKTLDEKRVAANRLLSNDDIRRKLLNQVVDQYENLFVSYAFYGRDEDEPEAAYFFAQRRHQELVRLINGAPPAERKTAPAKR